MDNVMSSIIPLLKTQRTLLIHGPYFPSMPLHLCLAHLRVFPHTESAVFLSPRRQELATTMREFSDTKFAGLTCGTSRILRQINLYFPPTPSHWLLLAASVRLLAPLMDLDNTRSKAMLRTIPAIIILHEPSSYFLQNGEENRHQFELSEYLQLITAFQAVAVHLTSSVPAGRQVPVVVFDSRLNELRLPMHRSVPHNTSQSDDHSAKEERIIMIVAHYFNCLAEVDLCEPEIPSSVPSEHVLSVDELICKRICTRLTRPSPEDGSMILYWSETRSFVASMGREETTIS